MITKTISSTVANCYKGFGFWSGFLTRTQLIRILEPTKPSGFTNIILGLCLILSALIPLLAGYHFVQSFTSYEGQEAAIAFVITSWFLGAVGFAFYRRVVVWPSLPRPAAETERGFAEATNGILAAKGGARWKILGFSLGQAAITVYSLYYINGHLVRGPLAVFLAVWLPAVLAIVLTVKTVKAFYAGNDYFSPADKTLLGIQLSTNLTVVALLVAGLVVYAAVIMIGLAVFIVGGFILWRTFAAQTNPANTGGLFDAPEKKTTRQWHDTSGSTHIDGNGRITEAHTGAFKGTVDDSGRVTGASGDYIGQVGDDGKPR